MQVEVGRDMEALEANISKRSLNTCVLDLLTHVSMLASLLHWPSHWHSMVVSLSPVLGYPHPSRLQ